MVNSQSVPWEQLFPPNADAPARRLRLVRKRGEPLLLLPLEGSLARTALTLYPAQTGKARCARWLVKTGLYVAPPLIAESVRLAADQTLPFAGFLAQAAGTNGLPRFAVLLGNPRAPGRRFVLLLFDDHGEPTALVKAGVGTAATKLVEAELGFLKSAPAGLLPCPQLRAECSITDLRAFAMNYIAGTTPHAGATESVARLLTTWLQPERTVRFADLAVAQRLAVAVGGNPRWDAMLRQLGEAEFHPAIHHGDFAPWNVRVDTRGAWRVIDWERSELSGPPAWDWFHWLIQHELLVRHTPTKELASRIESLMSSTAFRDYAARAGIDDCAQFLMIAYLLYCCQVIHQADALPEIEALLHQFSEDILKP